MTTKRRSYGRGILRFTSWEPCRLPGQTHNSNGALKQEETARKHCVENVNHVQETTPEIAGKIIFTKLYKCQKVLSVDGHWPYVFCVFVRKLNTAVLMIACA